MIGLISAVLDILFGLNRPTVADKDENALLWSWIDSLPSVRRSRIVENLRFQEVFDTLWSFGYRNLGYNEIFRDYGIYRYCS